jgi:hypothetical protein
MLCWLISEIVWPAAAPPAVSLALAPPLSLLPEPIVDATAVELDELPVLEEAMVEESAPVVESMRGSEEEVEDDAMTFWMSWAEDEYSGL